MSAAIMYCFIQLNTVLILRETRGMLFLSFLRDLGGTLIDLTEPFRHHFRKILSTKARILCLKYTTFNFGCSKPH